MGSMSKRRAFIGKSFVTEIPRPVAGFPCGLINTVKPPEDVY